MNIAVASHALAMEENRPRWKALAHRHPDTQVTLLVPHRWESHWFGGLDTWQGRPEADGPYRVLPVRIARPGDWQRYLMLSVDAHLRALQPDILYVIQEETTWVLQQLLLYRRWWSRRTRVIFFTWNNVDTPFTSFRQRAAWRRTCAQADAAVAGNQEARDLLVRRGFRKPLLLQTEIGVDTVCFAPDPAQRAATRQRQRLGEAFVIGYVGRLVEAKGLTDLLASVRDLAGAWHLLLVGDGDLRPALATQFRAWGLADRLTVVPAVPKRELPAYYQAMDGLVLPSRTTPGWKEQFGLVLAEAMACGVPVIGSSSGAIPEVIGDAGLVFPEGDVRRLAQCLQSLMQDREQRARWSQKARARALSTYGAGPLADGFHSFCRELLE